MSNNFKINYTEVYSKTAELRNRIESELASMEGAYRQVQSGLQGLDGKANAAFIEAMDDNQMKAHITAETLHKLLSFIELSARQVEQDELRLKSMYTLARAREAARAG